MGVSVGGVSVYLEYPDGTVGIPGSGTANSVQNSVDAGASNFSANDLDYAIRVVAVTSDNVTPVDPTDAMDITFHTCSGAGAPTIGQFRCVVESASDLNGVPVAGISCTVASLM